MKQPSVGEALRRFLGPFTQRFSVGPRILDCFRRLSRCHTGQLGWSLIQCHTCSHLHWTPNGCGDRHCPDCHGRQRELWLEKQRHDLLPVRYYHWVFTLPALLRPLALQNQQLIYTLMFEAASQSLLRCGRQSLNAQIGITALLHTWGQNLMNHPHLHCLVTGGGLTPEGSWNGPKNDRFLFSVHAVSKIWRSKFIDGLRELRSQDKLQFHGKIQSWSQPTDWAQMLHQLRQSSWVVFAKGSVTGSQALLNYLGRYTHRVAITNSRLLKIDDHTVSFRAKNYRKNGRVEELTLSGVEFLRRLSLHILPPRFTKVRHFGLLANNRRKKALEQARAALADSPHRADLSQAPPMPTPTGSPIPCAVCGGLDHRCVGRTDSEGRFSAITQGATQLFIRIGLPPFLDSS